MALACQGCGGLPSVTGPQTVTIKISPNPVPPLAIGQSVIMSVAVTGTNRSVNLHSANTNVLTFNPTTGVATCVSDGYTDMTALSIDGGALVVDQVAISCGMVSVVSGPIFFTHVTGTSACPAAIGDLILYNLWPSSVSVTVSTPSTLSVSASDRTFVLGAGSAARSIPLSFTCSTQSSFVGVVTVTSVSGTTTEVKTMTVNATVR